MKKKSQSLRRGEMKRVWLRKKGGHSFQAMGKRNSHARSKTLRASKKKKVMFGIRNTVHNKTGNKKKKRKSMGLLSMQPSQAIKKKKQRIIYKKKRPAFRSFRQLIHKIKDSVFQSHQCVAFCGEKNAYVNRQRCTMY